MKDVDPERVGKLVGSMREAVGLLRELAGLPEADFAADRHLQSSAKYNFVSGIEAAVDIANHLISRQGLRSPEDYADTFQVLAEARLLDPDFAGELKKMARFRNRLVHRYWDVDVQELRTILQTRLADFEAFISQISARVF